MERRRRFNQLARPTVLRRVNARVAGTRSNRSGGSGGQSR